ncbi:hypothetical protein ANCCAN_27172 [Ancylostoma caninum]|uniref:Uncharacterized protein n=1 Tax=Ancylostoma caninum TaxID=29170 RepID=A0A368F4U0_ANCCA|nr:hypothetical protein ANCCAN_27172 [Ancylostoma caninum]
MGKNRWEEQLKQGNRDQRLHQGRSQQGRRRRPSLRITFRKV